MLKRLKNLWELSNYTVRNGKTLTLSGDKSFFVDSGLELVDTRKKMAKIVDMYDLPVFDIKKEQL